jgi:peptidoglycan/LPS O-acetylase OafA/YrhL
VARLGYRPALDGVRGLAIAPVVALHAFGWPSEGALGVDLFFVLSGFLITALLLEERASTGTISFRRFYRRRAARLVPGLFVMLALYIVVARGAHGWAVFFAATYTTNIVNVITPDAIPWSLGHLWSLAQEEQFYLWWPPLLLLLVRTRPVLLPRIIGVMILGVVLEKIVLLATGAGLLRIYFAPDAHADPILIGCLFGALFATGRAPALGRLGGSLAFLAVVGSVLASGWLAFLGATSPLRTLFAFACGLLILAAVEDRVVARVLAMRPLVFLGRISYSLYLWHVPVLAAAGAAAYDGRTIRSTFAICGAVAVATASFYLVERPLRRRWRQRQGIKRMLAPAVQPTT